MNDVNLVNLVGRVHTSLADFWPPPLYLHVGVSERVSHRVTKFTIFTKGLLISFFIFTLCCEDIMSQTWHLLDILDQNAADFLTVFPAFSRWKSGNGTIFSISLKSNLFLHFKGIMELFFSGKEFLWSELNYKSKERNDLALSVKKWKIFRKKHEFGIFMKYHFTWIILALFVFMFVLWHVYETKSLLVSRRISVGWSDKVVIS